MKINKKVLYAAGILSVAYIPLCSQSHADMSLVKALELTVENHPQIAGDKASAKAREYVTRRAQAGYLPKLDASLSGGYEYTRNKFWQNSCSNAQDCHAELFRSNPTLNLTQNLFDGFKTTSDVNKARADQIQGEKKVDETVEQLAFRAANAYIDVRRFQRLMREAKRNLAAHKKISESVEKLIKGGRSSTADRFTVQARIASAANAIADIQGDLDTAVAEFKSVVGVEPDRLVTARIREEYLPPCLADAIRIARDNNKSVILARSSVDVATAELELASAAYFPTFGLEASAGRSSNNGARNGRADVYNVLGVIRYNLYNGGADSARTGEMTEKVGELRHRLESEYRTSEQEVRKSWGQMQSSSASAKETRKSVKALKQEKEAFEKQYEIGTRTLIDVLGATNEYFLARGALITTDAAIDIAGARLLSAMGVLTEKYGFKRNSPVLKSDAERTNMVGTNYDTKNCTNKMPGSSIEVEAENDELLKPLAAETSTEKEGNAITDFLTNLGSSDTATATSTTPSYTAETAPESVTAPSYTADTSGLSSFDPPMPLSTSSADSSTETTGGNWLTSVFSNAETNVDAAANTDTTISDAKATSDVEKHVVFGDGITVPSEIVSGQSME